MNDKVRRKIVLLLCLVLIYALSGCSYVSELSRVLWGSSTVALERSRIDGLSRIYNCSFEESFESVLSLARNEDISEPLSGKKIFDVFIKDWLKSHIVVMGIEGNIDTTEVGIFFSRRDFGQTNVEVSSRSSSAKRKAAKAVFDELDLRCEK